MLRLFVTIAEAQSTSDVDAFIERVNTVIVNPLIILLFAIAFLLFFTGLLRFFFQRDQSSEEAKKGRQHMLWGIIGMFIMMSVFGIMAAIKNTLGV
jgi:Na+-driven multidrug efflux pump